MPLSELERRGIKAIAAEILGRCEQDEVHARERYSGCDDKRCDVAVAASSDLAYARGLKNGVRQIMQYIERA